MSLSIESLESRQLLTTCQEAAFPGSGPLPELDDQRVMVIDGHVSGGDCDDVIDLADYPGIHEVRGGYGKDTIFGSPGNDILTGGFGDDFIDAGPGDDTIIIGSDGREPEAYEARHGIYDDSLLTEPKDRHFQNQWLTGQDEFIGGPGADLFRLDVRINAPEHIIRKYADVNGVIDWPRIAMEENAQLHAHWVEGSGYQNRIRDYNPAEGDRIFLDGHTIQLWIVQYKDTGNDGIDDTLLWLRSFNASGNAHHGDKIGLIIVDNIQLERADIEVDSFPMRGLYPNISDMQDLLAPARGVTRGEGGGFVFNHWTQREVFGKPQDPVERTLLVTLSDSKGDLTFEIDLAFRMRIINFLQSLSG